MPVSLGIALFITQVAPRWLRTAMVYVIDLLAVVPSVVFGLWGVLVLAPNIVGVYRLALATRSTAWPVLGVDLRRQPAGPLVPHGRASSSPS